MTSLRAMAPFVLGLAAWLGAALPAQRPAALPLRVLLVADGLRGPAFEAVLRAGGLRVRRLPRERADVRELRIWPEVVVYDWPDMLGPGNALPLGERARWDRPTVLLGLAGEHLPRRWGLPTSQELLAMSQAEYGPEFEVMTRPPGATVTAFRQGNLVHFATEASAAELAAADREWLAQVVAHVATCAIDRPIVRHATENGAPLPAIEDERLARLATAFATYGHDPWQRDLLADLIPKCKEDGAERAMLQALLLEDLDTSGTHLEFRVQLTKEALFWDPLARGWRLDYLEAIRNRRYPHRGTAPEPPRLDAGVVDPDLLDVVERIAVRYGVVGFADLATFACWRGDRHLLWNRRTGIFRVEDHAAGARQKVVAVADVLDERAVVGPHFYEPPGDAAARQEFVQMLLFAFAPVLIADHGAAVRREPQYDRKGKIGICVLPNVRLMEPEKRLYAIVDAASGEIAELGIGVPFDRRQGAPRFVPVGAVAACGPMSLPIAAPGTDAHRLPEWNPTFADDLAAHADAIRFGARPADR